MCGDGGDGNGRVVVVVLNIFVNIYNFKLLPFYDSHIQPLVKNSSVYHHTFIEQQ
jgi:hypothetical protein